jgi:hypothetical protein
VQVYSLWFRAQILENLTGEKLDGQLQLHRFGALRSGDLDRQDR